MPELMQQPNAEKQLADDETTNGILGVFDTYGYQRTQTDADESPQQGYYLCTMRRTSVAGDDCGIRDVGEGCISHKEKQPAHRQP